MKLVVDANRIFSALIKRGFTLELFKMLGELGVELMVPQYLLEEVKRKESRLSTYSGLSPIELDFVLKLVLRQLRIVPRSVYERFSEKARQLVPHEKDTPYFALALASDCFIWSDEKAFKKQNKVKVFSTKELVEFLSSLRIE